MPWSAKNFYFLWTRLNIERVLGWWAQICESLFPKGYTKFVVSAVQIYSENDPFTFILNFQWTIGFISGWMHFFRSDNFSILFRTKGIRGKHNEFFFFLRIILYGWLARSSRGVEGSSICIPRVRRVIDMYNALGTAPVNIYINMLIYMTELHTCNLLFLHLWISSRDTWKDTSLLLQRYTYVVVVINM